MGTLNKFASDKELEKEGIDLDFGEGMIVKVRRAGGANHKFASVMRAQTKKNKYRIDHDLLTPEEDLEMMATVYADAVIIGWSGVTDSEQKTIKHSRAAVIKTFCAYPEFFKAVRSECEGIENFKREELEVDAKN